MSFRHRFSKAMQERMQAHTAATAESAMAALDAKLSAFAKDLPAALEEIFQSAGGKRAPGRILRRRTECLFHLDDETLDLTPAALAQVPGYAALLAVCASPETDVALNVRIKASRHDIRAEFRLNLDAPFAAGAMEVSAPDTKPRRFDVATGQEVLPPAPPVPPTPDPFLTAGSTTTDSTITVKRPLQLKK